MKKTILVVEDNVWQADELARVLGRSGYMVRHASDALTAIDMIDQQLPDVVVLDMMLPGSNGMTLIHELRSHHDLAGLRVVMCSSHALPRSELMRYGVVDVLDKATMTPASIVASVQGALA